MKKSITGNKYVLVIGGAGYIGTHVVEQLLIRNYRVRIFDQFVFGLHDISDLLNNPNLDIVRGDISRLNELIKAFKDIQTVVHLAGLVGDPACAIDKEFTIHTNIASTSIIKDVSKTFSISRFIFASSCSVYGSSEKKVNETSKLNPVSLYAKTKIDSENQLLNDHDRNFHPVILRFATAFGHSRRPRFDLITNYFSAQAYNEGIVTVTGSKQWRPFIHARDLALAIVKTIEAPENIVNRQIINVGDERLNATIGDLAQKVITVIPITKNGTKTKIITKIDTGDKRNYFVSFEKIKRVLGFKSTISIEDGIREIYNNFKNGIYPRSFRDPRYINSEMTKLLREEYKSLSKVAKLSK
ncbi:MAG: NAD(P)-dependent oxidoreductase [Bacteroidota bacterium]